MENPRPEKIAVVDEVRQKLSSADATLLTEYRGLTVRQMADLRRSLRAAGGEYKVYKNTLVRFAARDLSLDIEDLLVGPTAIAFVEGDAVAVAKALRDYSKTNDKLVVKGGLLGTKRLSAAEADALATMPSRDELLARLAGGFQAPMAKMAGLLAALPRNFAYGLKALIDQQGGAPAAEAPEAPAEEVAEAPATEVPAEEATAEEATAEEAPTEEAPTEEAPTEEAPTEEAPTEEAPTEAPEATDPTDTTHTEPAAGSEESTEES